MVILLLLDNVIIELILYIYYNISQGIFIFCTLHCNYSVHAHTTAGICC